MKRKAIICLLVLFTAVAFMPAKTYAASKTVKSTAYSVYKSGKYIYCTGKSGIYKVKVKKGKVVSRKQLVRLDGYGSIYSFIKKGKYLYFQLYSTGTPSDLCRVRITGGKMQKLVHFSEDGAFAVKGKKIYYTGYNGNYKYVRKVMNLNGSGKKNTKVTPERSTVESNVLNYESVTKTSGKYYKDYLKTPAKSNYLGKVKIPF